MLQSAPLNQSQLVRLFRSHMRPAEKNEEPKEATQETIENQPLVPLTFNTTTSSEVVSTTHTPLSHHHATCLVQIPTQTIPLTQPQLVQSHNNEDIPITNTSTVSMLAGDAHQDMAPANDGLKWRKYGRKQLRNGGHPRDYYRCTVAGCNAKKQVERSTDKFGKPVLNTTYVGEHTHDTPKFSHFVVTTQEQLVERVMKAFEEMRALGKEGKIEIECSETVNCLDDGFHWRKYGQKKVKGSPHPRSYYKCSFSDSLCSVKKIVEQRTDGTRVNSYEGYHNHGPESFGENNNQSYSTADQPNVKRLKKEPSYPNDLGDSINSMLPRVSLMDEIPVLSAAERNSLDLVSRETYDISAQYMPYPKLYDTTLATPSFFYSVATANCVSMPPPVTVLSQGP